MASSHPTSRRSTSPVNVIYPHPREGPAMDGIDVDDVMSKEEKARELRSELDDLLYRVKKQTAEEQLRTSVEEQFLLLISKYPDHALERAVHMTWPPALRVEISELVASTTTTTTDDDAQEEESFSGRLPIHLACDSSAPIGVIQCLLNSDIRKTSVLAKDRWGDLPIHTVCSRMTGSYDYTFGVLRLLLENDHSAIHIHTNHMIGTVHTKHSILMKDHHGSLPLHMACRYNAPPQIIQLLLDSDLSNKSIRCKGIYGQLPIHVACRCQLSPTVISLLLQKDEDKASLLETDNVGRLPIHVALLHTDSRSSSGSMETIELLLQGMVGNRMERLGLDLWKRDIERMVKRMSTDTVYERDMVTRDRLDDICKALHSFMDRAFLLELIVWKASCLAFVCDGNGNNNKKKGTSGGFQFLTMQAIASLGATDPSFDPCEYKRERRIKSGAEVIIRGVLSFLEDEPIDTLVKELE